MKLSGNFFKLNTVIFAFLILITGVLGYMLYNSDKANTENAELIKQTKADNLDLSQDLEIVKDKYDRLKTEISVLKTKVAKVSYRNKIHKKRSSISSAGRSSKYKQHLSKNNISYKKLYFKLLKQCNKHKYSYKRK